MTKIKDFEKGGEPMNTAVTITLIICATLVLISLIGKIGKNKDGENKDGKK